MTGYSKAPQGLFVLLQGMRIFTHTSISPGPSLRQCSARYTFRAGRNLPDKEFRYLRTVIVTAAVHRGFSSPLARFPLTFRHWAGVSPYTSLFSLAETCAFGKQSTEPLHCDPPCEGCPFSRSYGTILPSSLTRVLPLTLVSSTRPPVSVCGTVDVLQHGMSFSRPGVPLTCGLTPRHRGLPPLTTSIHSEAQLPPGFLIPLHTPVRDY
jgi:hypothetical protein